MALGTAAILGLLGGGAALARGAGNIATGAQEFNRDDRERLRQLERQQALGLLGMTPAEREAAQRQILQPLQTIEQQAAAERRAQLASQDLGQGAAYRQMQAQEQVRQQGRLMAQQMLQQQQEAAIARDQAEMAALEDARKRRRQMMIQGGTQAVSEGLQAGASAFQAQQAELAQQQMREDMMAIANKQIDAQKYLPATNYLYRSPYVPGAGQ